MSCTSKIMSARCLAIPNCMCYCFALFCLSVSLYWSVFALALSHWPFVVSTLSLIGCLPSAPGTFPRAALSLAISAILLHTLKKSRRRHIHRTKITANDILQDEKNINKNAATYENNSQNCCMQQREEQRIKQVQTWLSVTYDIYKQPHPHPNYAHGYRALQ